MVCAWGHVQIISDDEQSLSVISLMNPERIAWDREAVFLIVSLQIVGLLWGWNQNSNRFFS